LWLDFRFRFWVFGRFSLSLKRRVFVRHASFGKLLAGQAKSTNRQQIKHPPLIEDRDIASRSGCMPIADLLNQIAL
jgi:hypothetical protein